VDRGLRASPVNIVAQWGMDSNATSKDSEVLYGGRSSSLLPACLTCGSLEGHFNTSRSGRAETTHRPPDESQCLHQGRPANGAGANDGQAGTLVSGQQYICTSYSICPLRSRGGTKRQRSYWMPPAATNAPAGADLDMLDLLPLPRVFRAVRVASREE
jgi:hypothetical protein